MPNRAIVVSAALLTVFLAAFATALAAHRTGQPVRLRPSQSVRTASSQESDTSDYRNLSGITHVVFVGKVLEKNEDGVLPTEKHPVTHYTVQSLFSIKRNLKGVVKLTQIHGVEPPAQVGSTYLFAVRFLPEVEWYTFGVQESFHMISNDASLSSERLIALARSSEPVNAMERAYPEKRLSFVDRRFNTAYNAYASRRFDANGEVIDDTVELAKAHAQQSQPSSAPAATTTPEPTPAA